jgi:hypothetical protein
MQESIITQYLFLGKNYRKLGINKILRKKNEKNLDGLYFKKNGKMRWNSETCDLSGDRHIGTSTQEGGRHDRWKNAVVNGSCFRVAGCLAKPQKTTDAYLYSHRSHFIFDLLDHLRIFVSRWKP